MNIPPGKDGVLGQEKGSGLCVKKFLMGIFLAVTGNVKIISPNKDPPPPPSEARGLLMSIGKPMEVELTWILFKGLKHFRLLILGF